MSSLRGIWPFWSGRRSIFYALSWAGRGTRYCIFRILQTETETDEGVILLRWVSTKYPQLLWADSRLLQGLYINHQEHPSDSIDKESKQFLYPARSGPFFHSCPCSYTEPQGELESLILAPLETPRGLCRASSPWGLFVSLFDTVKTAWNKMIRMRK